MVIVKSLLSKIVNFIFPPQCIICKSIIDNEDGLCPVCINDINFITDPKCEYCGYPFEFKTDNKFSVKLSICAKCLNNKPKFDKALSVVHYNDASKKIILPFKHADKTNYAKIMGNMMANTIAPFVAKMDFIIPVPIHLKRMIKRKYNQSALLASHISKRLDIPVLYNVLVRSHFKYSQGKLSFDDRKANVLNAFDIKNPYKIKGKNILLVDDVMTTGATLNECARILKNFDARRVYVITFARVVR